MEEIDVPENSSAPAAEISLTSFDLTTGSTESPIRLSVEIPHFFIHNTFIENVSRYNNTSWVQT